MGRKFSFVISRPYTRAALVQGVHFDEVRRAHRAGADQVEDLDIHEADKPPGEWLTLLDTSGTAKTRTGTRTARSWSRLHRQYLGTCTCRGAPRTGKIGELEVDIFKNPDLEDVATPRRLLVVSTAPPGPRFQRRRRGRTGGVRSEVSVPSGGHARAGDRRRVRGRGRRAAASGKIKVPAAGKRGTSRWWTCRASTLAPGWCRAGSSTWR